MKRIVAIVLTLLTLLTGFSALAETIFRTEIPLELGTVTVFDFGDIRRAPTMPTMNSATSAT